MDCKIKNLSSIVLNWSDKGRRGTWLFCFFINIVQNSIFQILFKIRKILNLKKNIFSKHKSFATQNNVKPVFFLNNVLAIDFGHFYMAAWVVKNWCMTTNFEKFEKNKLFRDFDDASWLLRRWKNVKIAVFYQKLLISLSKMSRFDNSSNFLIWNTNFILIH